MDLEMTGLDPARHVIVEIATLITDDELQLVAEGPDLVIHASPEQLAGMDNVVRKMHTDSGLLAQIEASTVSLADAGAATLEFIKELCRRWYPDVLANAPAKEGAHRALDDIKESVKELQYYRGTVFKQ
jgi:oligoribonuclease